MLLGDPLPSLFQRTKILNPPGHPVEFELKKGVEDVVVNELRVSSIRNNANYWVALMKILMKTFENHSKDLRYLLRFLEIRE